MKSILAYGDSNTYGYNPSNGLRYDEGIRWTGRLAMLLGSEYRVIEEGCNGRTTVYDDPVDGWKNGLPYLAPCLNTHKPIDIVIMMLGSNDLKVTFNASAGDIAGGVGTLVKTVISFTEDKQGFVPKIILVSPPEIGEGIQTSPFYGRFREDAITRSRQFPKYYSEIAKKYGCIFFNAAEWVSPSDIDSLHLDPEAHKVLAEKLFEIITQVYSVPGHTE